MVLVHDNLALLTNGQDTPVTIQWTVGNGAGSALVLTVDGQQLLNSVSSQDSFQIGVCKDLANKTVNCFFTLQDLMKTGSIITDIQLQGCNANLDNHKGNGYKINCAPGGAVVYNLVINFF